MIPHRPFTKQSDCAICTANKKKVKMRGRDKEIANRVGGKPDYSEQSVRTTSLWSPSIVNGEKEVSRGEDSGKRRAGKKKAGKRIQRSRSDNNRGVSKTPGATQNEGWGNYLTIHECLIRRKNWKEARRKKRRDQPHRENGIRSKFMRGLKQKSHLGPKRKKTTG